MDIWFNFASELHDRLDGSCNDFFDIVENMIEEYGYDKDIWKQYELEIISYVESFIFRCASCGWWFGIEDESENIVDEIVCINCEDVW